MTGGLITAMPMTVEEAKKMGEDLVSTKGGQTLSKASGFITYKRINSYHCNNKGLIAHR